MLDVTVKVIKKAPSENLKKSKEIYLNNSLNLYSMFRLRNTSKFRKYSDQTNQIRNKIEIKLKVIMQCEK